MKVEKFKCPICEKEIEIKSDGKYIYHRPWMFHIAIDHADLFKKGIITRKDTLLWLYYPWIGSEKFQKELLEGIKR